MTRCASIFSSFHTPLFRACPEQARIFLSCPAMQPLRIVVVEDGPLLVDDHDTTLRHMGLIDGRTGLPHRDLLLDRLGQAAAGVARGGSAFALVVIGLGAAEGPGDLDESAVEAFASRLHSLGRRTDSYARIAPDAFAGLLSGNPAVAGVMGTIAAKPARRSTRAARSRRASTAGAPTAPERAAPASSPRPHRSRGWILTAYAARHLPPSSPRPASCAPRWWRSPARASCTSSCRP